MKINWKQLAQSPGYKSLKAALIKDIGGNGRNPSWRSKKELYKHFYWIIGRAKHYAHHIGLPVEEILRQWESDRKGGWFGYYQDRKPFNKFGTGKPRNVKPMSIRTSYRTSPWFNKREQRQRIKSAKESEAKLARKKAGKKRRWSMAAKKREARYREIVKEQNSNQSL